MTRIEHDSLGEMAVPDDALWGAQTQRAIENFDLSGRPFPLAVIRHLARIKIAAARVNGAAGTVAGLTPEVAAAIEAAAIEIIEGRHDEQFPIDTFQTGSATSSNMNVNEVISRIVADRTGLTAHPNDHVNAAQSSNDTVPTAIHLAVIDAGRTLDRAATTLTEALSRAGERFATVVKTGRTHLMDAAPVFLGWEFDGWSTQVAASAESVARASDGLADVPLGGSAVGTGLNVPDGWAAAVRAELIELTDVALIEPRHAFASQAGRDALVEVSGAHRRLAVTLHKLCNDLRLLGSGPFGGLGELQLPAVQPGSSIMPGKVNPVIAEAVIQGCLRVFGNDVTVGLAAATGQLEITATMPVMVDALLESSGLLERAMSGLADKCIDGVDADEARCAALAGRSPAIVTGIAPVIGYEVAARVAHAMSVDASVTVEAALASEGIEPARIAEFAAQLDPSSLAGGSH